MRLLGVSVAEGARDSEAGPRLSSHQGTPYKVSKTFTLRQGQNLAVTGLIVPNAWLREERGVLFFFFITLEPSVE